MPLFTHCYQTAIDDIITNRTLDSEPARYDAADPGSVPLAHEALGFWTRHFNEFPIAPQDWMRDLG